MNKKSLAHILHFLYFLIAIGLSPAIYAQRDQGEPIYLFIQSAKSAKIIKTDKPDHYKIILNKIDPLVMYFSTRPGRDMGMLKVDDFLVKLKEIGKEFSPKGLNAVIVETKNIKIKDNRFAFTLFNPIRDKTTLTYDAIVVPNQKTKTKPIPDQDYFLDQVYVFIDACIGCV